MGYWFPGTNYLASLPFLASSKEIIGLASLPTFAWCRPTIAHLSWDYRPVVRRVARWVDNMAKGKDDLRQTLTKIEFVEGGTMGPPPES